MPNLKTNAPAVAETTNRGEHKCFEQQLDNTVARPCIQLAGSPSERIVALDSGAVVAWSNSIAGVSTRVHVVAPLCLDDPALSEFCQVVGRDPDAIVCMWGAS